MYSLKRSSKSITIENEGVTEELTLTEMTAAQRDSYLDRLTKRIKHGPDGKSQGVAKFDGLQADLISSCLYRGKSLVPIEEIQKWPASVVAGIFKEAQDLNLLGQELKEAADAKNG